MPRRSIVGNIYKGRIDNVLAGMEAAFVDIGLEKNGFLHVDEIVLPGVDVADFAGTWSNFRFPSGNVALSLIEEQTNGLMMVRPTLPDTAGGPSGDGSKGSGGTKKKCKRKRGPAKAKGKPKSKRKCRKGKRKKKR